MSALALPPGEATKGWAQLARAVEWLLAAAGRARDMVVAWAAG
jgi:3-dehydroquinate synthase